MQIAWTEPVPILAVGGDVLEVRRVERAVSQLGQPFLCRVFTSAEQLYCLGRSDRLAALFALKEAVSKALGVGLACVSSEGIGLLDVEVVAASSNGPSIILHGLARVRADQLGLKEWSISVAHSGRLVVALAVATSGE